MVWITLEILTYFLWILIHFVVGVHNKKQKKNREKKEKKELSKKQEEEEDETPLQTEVNKSLRQSCVWGLHVAIG